MRSDNKKNERNKNVLSRLKTKSKRFSVLVAEKNIDAATKEVAILVKEYDTAASKGIIPQKRADRKKSRITIALNKLVAANSNQ